MYGDPSVIGNNVNSMLLVFYTGIMFSTLKTELHINTAL